VSAIRLYVRSILPKLEYHLCTAEIRTGKIFEVLFEGPRQLISCLRRPKEKYKIRSFWRVLAQNWAGAVDFYLGKALYLSLERGAGKVLAQPGVLP
jgi:hypothetical protein